VTTIAADASYRIDYAYNSLGALHTLTYPVSTSGYRLKLQYDYQHGQLLRIKDFNAPATVFWQANATDARGRAIDEQLGGSLQRLRGFDPVSGRIEYIQTGPGGSAAVQNLVYQWDGVGNLSWRRDDNQNLTEAFVYDHLHRLTSSTLNGANNLTVAYNALGNITSKTGVGTYTYHATKKHAVVSTSSGGSYAYDANGNMTSRNGSTISWSSFNLPTVINGSGGNASQFFYTPDRARYKQVASYAGSTETTIYVGGILEKLTRGSLTEFRHLIQSGQEHTVIHTRRSNGTTATYHVTRDHLGSAAAITDANGNVLIQESFTAFGERRGANWAGSPSSADWTQIANTTRRGFTDHEHLDNLNLIHMNGRVYDPGLGRFISADPFIDGWGQTQGFNRYSYVKNNPLRAVDPSGFKEKKDPDVTENCEAGPCGPKDDYRNPDGSKVPEIIVTGRRLQSSRGGEAQIFASVEFPWREDSGSFPPELYGDPMVWDPPIDPVMLFENVAVLLSPAMWAAQLGRLMLARTAAGMHAAKGTHVVYQGIDKSGVVRYVGRTSRNVQTRAAEHAASGGAKEGLIFRAVQGGENLSLQEARMLEQHLINQYGLGRYGGQLLNEINSISPKYWSAFGISP
jgi:RHS repeat-associated protein